MPKIWINDPAGDVLRQATYDPTGDSEIGAGVGCDCRSPDAVECLSLWIKDLPHANPAIASDGGCHCDCHTNRQR